MCVIYIMAYHKRRTMKHPKRGKKAKRSAKKGRKGRRKSRKQSGGVLSALKSLILPGAFTMAVMSRKGRKGRKKRRTMKRGRWLNKFNRKPHSFKLKRKSRRRRRR